RSVRRFCDASGELAPRGPTIWRLSAVERGAIETEFGTQIEALIASGIQPSHLDSHQHFHTQWPVGPIVVSLARRYGVHAIRLSRNCGQPPSLMKRLYKTVYNARLSRSGLAPTRHFGSAGDVDALEHIKGPVEIMVHPELDAAGRVVNAMADGHGGAEPLEPVASTWRQRGTLASFRELS
ncbi:MAG TPA: ChbG/HpnK family deacetylase, partial [Candidatus Deferrimicrobium sp.]|nr:ChbG/HpnK family deacetylase [Candidatus Deferrimicrobium sp.]